MSVYGYLRVSTKDQNIDNNRKDIITLAYEQGFLTGGQSIIWCEETVTGRKSWKHRKIGQIYNSMIKGDVLIMSEVSRIGRTFWETVQFFADCREKGIILRSTSGDIPVKDDNTAGILLSLRVHQAELEREDISRRTKIGLQKRKDDGQTLGRPKKMDLERDLEVNKIRIKKMIDEDIRRQRIAKNVGCTEKTLRKFIQLHLIEVKNTSS